MAQDTWVNSEKVVEVLGASGKILNDLTELFVIHDEVIEARDGEASLNDRINTAETSAGASQVAAAASAAAALISENNASTSEGNASTSETNAAASAAEAQALVDTSIASATHAATEKTTPVGADEVGIIDSEASNVLKKITLSNLFKLGERTNRDERTSNTILGVDDSGELIDVISGTFTQTFTAAATLGAGWSVIYKNTGTGDITLDPDGSETIDGLTSFTMYPGECRLITCDGTDFYSAVLSGFYKVFASTDNFIVPPGYPQNTFGTDCFGGGDGGMRPAAGGTSAYGGGGGGRVLLQVSALTPGDSVTCTVGAGGDGATTIGGNGTPGGTSSFGDYVKAGGGSYGNGGWGMYSHTPATVSSKEVHAVGWQGVRKPGSPTDQINCGEWGGGCGGWIMYSGGSSLFSAGGGGGGGNLVGNAAGAGGASRSYASGGGGAGANSNTPGGDGDDGVGGYGGDGGGGGMGASYGTAGGNGGIPGGGGGCGGCHSSSPGNGGNGARGEIRVWGVI